MKWIDVKEDLPPSGSRVLGHVQFREDGNITISDVYFDASMGWYTWGYENHIYKVYHWHPLSSEPPATTTVENKSIQRSLEEFRAAVLKLDDNQ